jgi:type IV secretion system protein VirB9
MKALIAALLMSLSAPALATETPRQISQDGYVCRQEYMADAVTYVHLEVGRETTVEISPDEKLTKVSASDTVHLLAAMIEGGHIFWLKPTMRLEPQPLTVVSTRPDGSTRVYLVQLDATDPSPQAPAISNAAVGVVVKPVIIPPCYLVRYIYPAEEAEKAKAKAKAQWNEGADRRQAIRNAALLRQNTIDNSNTHYVGIGSEDLAPDRIFDDGYSTFLQFEGNRSVPAPYAIDRKKKDKLLTGFTTIDGPCPGSNAAATCLKLHSIQKIIRLRDQEDDEGTLPSLLIFNRAFNAVGNRPGTGTSSPYVQREVRSK